MPSDEWEEPLPLPDGLSGTTLVSPSGRVYHLFGNEEKTFSMPEIPAIPESLGVPKPLAFTLEEALQQIETFATSATENKVAETSAQPKPSLTLRTAEQSYTPEIATSSNPPTIQLHQALGESVVAEQPAVIGIPLKFVKSETAPPRAALSIDSVALKGFPTLPSPALKQNDEKRQTLRVVSAHSEEPFIVPYVQPVEVAKETETKSTMLRVVSGKSVMESTLSPAMLNRLRCTKILKKSGQHRRNERAQHRKHFSLPPVSAVPVVESPVVCEPKPLVDPTTFRWSDQLNSLMQTAENQIQMLTDHLVVRLSQGMKGICFKSVFPGDGCSTIMLCAARALTERNFRVLLVDAHHRHIDLPKQLNLSGDLDTGNEVIELNNRLGLWAWQESKTTEENVKLLAKVVQTYRSKYDLILVDDGSITESPLMDFIAFWNQVDLSGVVLVSNIKRSSELPMSHIAKRFRQHHVPLVGIAENYV